MCVDGPSGSGKSTLARRVARIAEDRGLTVHVLHADDLLDGWDGLPGLGRGLHDYVVGPLASRPSRALPALRLGRRTPSPRST